MRAGQARPRAQERHRQRAVLPGALSGLSGDAGRAGHRGARAAVGARRWRSDRWCVAIDLRRHRRRALQAAGRRRAISSCSNRAWARWCAASGKFTARGKRRRRARGRGADAHVACADSRRAPPDAVAVRWPPSTRPRIVDPPRELAADVDVGAVLDRRARRAASARARSSARTSSSPARTTLGRATASSSSRRSATSPQDRKYGGEPTTHDDRRRQRDSANTCRSTPARRRTAATRRSATATGSSPTCTSRTIASSATRPRSRTTRSSRAMCSIDDSVTWAASPACTSSAASARTRWSAAAAIVLQDVPPFVTVAGLSRQAARHQQRGPAPARLRRGRHRSTVRRAYKTLYREGLSLDDARAKLAAAARDAPVLAAAGRVSRGAAAAASCAGDAMRMGERAAAPSRSASSPARRRATRSAATLIRARARADPDVALRRHRGAAMEAAGCEAWFPLETLAVRGFVEVLAHLPELVRIRRALRAAAARGARSALRRRRRARLQPRARAQAQAPRRAHDPLREPVGVGVAARAHRHASAAAVDRMLALFPFEPPLYEAARHPGDLRRPSAGARMRRRTPRGARRASCCSSTPRQPVFALLPGSRLSELEMHARPRARRPRPRIHGRAPTRTSSCRSRRARRATRSRRRCTGRAASSCRSRCSTAMPRCAARRRRRHRRVGHRDARGRARALPACHLLSRQRA